MRMIGSKRSAAGGVDEDVRGAAGGDSGLDAVFPLHEENPRLLARSRPVKFGGVDDAGGSFGEKVLCILRAHNPQHN